MTDIIGSVSSLLIISPSGEAGIMHEKISIIDLDTLKEEVIYKGTVTTAYTFLIDSKIMAYTYNTKELYLSNSIYVAAINSHIKYANMIAISRNEIVLYNNVYYSIWNIKDGHASSIHTYDNERKCNVREVYRMSDDSILFHKENKLIEVDITNHNNKVHILTTSYRIKQISGNKFLLESINFNYIVNFDPEFEMIKLELQYPGKNYNNVEYINSNELILYSISNSDYKKCIYKYYIDTKKLELIKSYVYSHDKNYSILYDRERDRIMYRINPILLHLGIGNNDTLIVSDNCELRLIKINNIRAIDNANKTLKDVQYINNNIKRLIAKFIAS